MRLLLAVVLVALVAGCAEETPAPTPTPTPATTTATTPAVGSTPPPSTGGSGCTSADGSKSATQPAWVLETSLGTIRMTLYCDKTPLTAQHFVNLTEKGYFDGTKFHRIIRDFMNQGGDPLTKDDTQSSRWGTGGPGFNIKDEFYCADGSVSYAHPAQCPTGLGLKHDSAGLLSMANTGRAQTGGSQFFLTAAATPWLDGKHAIFGKAADPQSLENILAMNKVQTGQGDRPIIPVVLERATIAWG